MGDEPQPSARVRLEIAFLDDSDTQPRNETADDGRPRLAVLVVAADADVRRYVGECLRPRTDLRVSEAPNIRAATERANVTPPDLVIVDERDGLEGLSHLRAIVLVDEIPYGAATASRIRLLTRPFSAEQLASEVEHLLQQSS